MFFGAGFSLDLLDMERGQTINVGTHEGDKDIVGAPNFDRLCHKLKVLLLLFIVTVMFAVLQQLG